MSSSAVAPRSSVRAGWLARLAVAAGLLALSACETAPPRPEFARLTYAHKAPIRLDVANVVVRQAYTPPMERPNVDHLFPVTPADAAMQWAQDRLVAAGDSGSAIYVVTDASATAEDLATDESLTDYFTKEQAERYTSQIAVELKVEKPQRSGQIRVQATRSTTVPEGASLNDRRRTWYEMTEKQMDELDRELEETLRANLGNWVLN